MKKIIYLLVLALFAVSCSSADNRDAKEKSPEESPLSVDQMALLSRVHDSFQYVGTERDSIAAVSVLGAVDSLIQKTEGADLLKFSLLIRARRFDEARAYAKSIDLAKRFEVPGFDTYLNLHIDMMEHKARGNDKALKATADKMYDYLKKEVASPEFDMESVLSGKVEVADCHKQTARAHQFGMLKAIAVYFKDPSESGKLAEWLEKLYPETLYPVSLADMPDRRDAEKTIFSAFPF